MATVYVAAESSTFQLDASSSIVKIYEYSYNDTYSKGARNNSLIPNPRRMP